MTFKICVLISGNGTNLQAIIDSIENKYLENVKIEVVISNKETAYGLERAKKASIQTRVFSLQSYLSKSSEHTRSTYGTELAKIIREYNVDLIVLAGWMIILPASFLKEFSDNKPTLDIINLHPALPGQYPGAHAIERAYNDFKDNKITHSGLMIHKVIEEVDAGEVLLTSEIPIYPEDTLETLEDRFHKQEHKSLVEAIKLISTKSN
ncbi:phosphoribosylglycinamide formyltransferase [Dictyostelium purpureum]|uniref:Phosphoribosylglycinamide formyltransferase n=1 Tax=Dictyostelium purpureum TaxID=5786 RepID=F0ZW27_DICPU|nr:phosphoribosylglycinamide formyltransferase [Dictyostelium purpureum]EGC31858.1 phosphoribosylglycinamide formyltransferase [Dictyostelium purpureum]|eukprot:XP_003291628.1 phosphoribosylglycinamide formyltransferase [Dictyostelium purpureum]